MLKVIIVRYIIVVLLLIFTINTNIFMFCTANKVLDYISLINFNAISLYIMGSFIYFNIVDYKNNYGKNDESNSSDRAA